MLRLLFLLLTTTACSMSGDKLSFVELKSFNAKPCTCGSPILEDIMQHEVPGEHNSYDDLITQAHETSHGIHSFIRNHMNETKTLINAFYVLENRAVKIKEPLIRKSQVAPYVPQSLRGSRFDLYITGQTMWDDSPLYIWDEWNAYTNGGAAGVELAQRGLWKSGWRDGVSGIIEFVVYALATGQAVKELDPEYFKNYSQFTEFLAWNITRSMKIYRTGSKMKEFTWKKQDDYFEKLLTSPDAEILRNFARETFGSDWTKETLGF